jgi:hypothetical protein
MTGGANMAAADNKMGANPPGEENRPVQGGTTTTAITAHAQASTTQQQERQVIKVINFVAITVGGQGKQNGRQLRGNKSPRVTPAPERPKRIDFPQNRNYSDVPLIDFKAIASQKVKTETIPDEPRDMFVGEQVQCEEKKLLEDATVDIVNRDVNAVDNKKLLMLEYIGADKHNEHHVENIPEPVVEFSNVKRR